MVCTLRKRGCFTFCAPGLSSGISKSLIGVDASYAKWSMTELRFCANVVGSFNFFLRPPKGDLAGSGLSSPSPQEPG